MPIEARIIYTHPCESTTKTNKLFKDFSARICFRVVSPKNKKKRKKNLAGKFGKSHISITVFSRKARLTKRENGARERLIGRRNVNRDKRADSSKVFRLGFDGSTSPRGKKKKNNTWLDCFFVYLHASKSPGKKNIQGGEASHTKCVIYSSER